MTKNARRKDRRHPPLLPEKNYPTTNDVLHGRPRALKHVLQAQQFDRHDIIALFTLANRLEREEYDIMRRKVLVWVGDEESSRTYTSFSMAALRLGGSVIPLWRSLSSMAKKGESVEDTISSLSAMGAAVIALRDPDEHAIWRAALVSQVPVINAGSGSIQHPTQGLLDLYTIYRAGFELRTLSIAMVGDLLYGRTTNSLAYLLSKFVDNVNGSGPTLYLVSPDHLRMKGDLRYYLHEKGVCVHETNDLESIIDKVDIVYQTRAQKERTDDASVHQGLSPYILSNKLVSRMRHRARIMHPLPRNEELPREIDGTPQQLYLEQMSYGVLLRMALLAHILAPKSAA